VVCFLSLIPFSCLTGCKTHVSVSGCLLVSTEFLLGWFEFPK
jgi:hypothetical protein